MKPRYAKDVLKNPAIKGMEMAGVVHMDSWFRELTVIWIVESVWSVLKVAHMIMCRYPGVREPGKIPLDHMERHGRQLSC